MSKSDMHADSLELPAGIDRDEMGWKFHGMRVVIQYEINRDAFIARFDTIIDGEQQNCCFESSITDSQEMRPRDFGWLCAPFAVRTFIEGKGTKGKVAQTPVTLSLRKDSPWL